MRRLFPFHVSKIKTLRRGFGNTSATNECGIEGGVQWKRGYRLAQCCCALIALLIPLSILNERASAQQNPSDSVATGEQIFSQRCAKCHGDHGEGRSAVISIAGPSLRAEHDYGQVMAAVEVGPSHMPSFAYVLSVDEIRDVSHYVVDKIADIPLTGGDLTKGGELFGEYCASCHRTAVRGGALAFSGVNAPPLTHKSAALIAGAIRWGPGPMPSFLPSVLDDKEVASVVRYVRYAEHPEHPGGATLHWYGPVPEGWVAWGIVLSLIGFTMWIEKGGKG